MDIRKGTEVITTIANEPTVTGIYRYGVGATIEEVTKPRLVPTQELMSSIRPV